MSMATLTSKGQVTIPKEIREELDLHPGDKLDFAVDERKQIRVTTVARTVAEVFGMLDRGAGRKALSVREMDGKVAEALRKEWA
jgi:AbrB family looped-hinge helix DNA binding protein